MPMIKENREPIRMEEPVNELPGFYDDRRRHFEDLNQRIFTPPHPIKRPRSEEPPNLFECFDGKSIPVSFDSTNAHVTFVILKHFLFQ